MTKSLHDQSKTDQSARKLTVSHISVGLLENSVKYHKGFGVRAFTKDFDKASYVA